MKNYVKPSALLSRFDVEEIMLSGTGVLKNKPASLDAVNNDVYKEYLNNNIDNAASGGYIEFQW